jgi:hypothetical protein
MINIINKLPTSGGDLSPDAQAELARLRTIRKTRAKRKPKLATNKVRKAKVADILGAEPVRFLCPYNTPLADIVAEGKTKAEHRRTKAEQKQSRTFITKLIRKNASNKELELINMGHDESTRRRLNPNFAGYRR